MWICVCERDGVDLFVRVGVCVREMVWICVCESQRSTRDGMELCVCES